MISSYLKELAGFAFERVLHRIDTVALLVGIVIPAVVQVSGNSAADTAGLVAWIVIGAVSALLVGRLLAAPYFLWRRQRTRIAELEAELGRPDRDSREMVARSLTQDRIRLADLIPRVEQAILNAERDAPTAVFDTDLVAIATRFNDDPVFTERLHDFYTAGWCLQKHCPEQTDFDSEAQFKVAMLVHSGGYGSQLSRAREDLVRYLLHGSDGLSNEALRRRVPVV